MAIEKGSLFSEDEQDDSKKPTIGYACKCGNITTDLAEFRRHLVSGPKGVHASLGKVDMATGEVLEGPFRQLSPEEQSKYQIRWKKMRDGEPFEEAIQQGVEQGDDGGNGAGPSKGKKQKTLLPRPTTDISSAQRLNMIPRAFTCDYTPVMRAAQVAAQELWGWPEMDFSDFLDTILFHFFDDRGIKIGGYYVVKEQSEKQGVLA